MDIVTSGCVSASSHPIDLRNLGSLVHTAEMQHQRQVKTLQALHKQAELTAEANAAWRESERRREEKYMHIDQGRQLQREAAVENNQRLAEARAARLEAAARHEEAVRAAAKAKVQADEERMARFEAEKADNAAAERQRIAAVEAKRGATYRQNVEMMEARRQALLARERRAEDILRQREELRRLQQQIKAEEDFLREDQRRAIKARADAELADRVAHFHAKNAAKDENASRRRQALEALRRARAEELRQRFEYIAAQANEAAAVAEAERQALAGRLEDKEARGAALEAHRAALLAEMQNLRQQMQHQEEVIRGSLVRMRQQGSVALPEEVVHSLDKLHLGGPVSATAMLGGGGGAMGAGGHSVGLLEGPPTLQAGMGAAAPPGMPRRVGAGAAAAGVRRPRSAATTPRGARMSSRVDESYNSSPRAYVMAPISPRVGQPAKARRMAAGTRPMSASIDLRGSATFSLAASPRSPAHPASASAAGSPRPRSPHVAHASSPASHPPRNRPNPTSLEEQLAAATDTSEVAAEAAASGRYSGVHEVARPGSRREEELRGVLQEEIAKESGRQALLAKVTDEAERARLVKYFTLEREEAKRRILALSNAAQAALYH